MKYQTRPAVTIIEAFQVPKEITIGGLTIPALSYVLCEEGKEATWMSPKDFDKLYEPCKRERKIRKSRQSKSGLAKRVLDGEDKAERAAL